MSGTLPPVVVDNSYSRREENISFEREEKTAPEPKPRTVTLNLPPEERSLGCLSPIALWGVLIGTAGVVALIALALIGTPLVLYFIEVLGIIPAAAIGGTGLLVLGIDFALICGLAIKKVYDKIKESRASPFTYDDPSEFDDKTGQTDPESEIEH